MTNNPALKNPNLLEVGDRAPNPAFDPTTHFSQASLELFDENALADLLRTHAWLVEGHGRDEIETPLTAASKHDIQASPFNQLFEAHRHLGDLGEDFISLISSR